MSLEMSTPSISVPSLLSSLPPVPTARDAVVFVLNVMAKASSSGYKIRIYLSKDISQEVTTLLAKLGIRFKTVQARDRVPPYMAIDIVERNVVIAVVNENGKTVKEVKVEKTKFIKEFTSILKKILNNKRNPKKRERKDEVYHELIIEGEDIGKIIEETMDELLEEK